MKAGKAKPFSAPVAADSFARGLDKPLTAEQLFRSILVAAGNVGGADGKIAGKTETELRRAFVAQYPDLFAPEYNATLSQAMFMANSPLTDLLLSPRDGNLADRLTKIASPEERVKAAFAAIYGRLPSSDEAEACLAYLKPRAIDAGVKQMIWALISSAEFSVNH